MTDNIDSARNLPDDSSLSPQSVHYEVERGIVASTLGEIAALRRGFTNWSILASKIAMGRLRGSPPSLRMRTRNGHATIETPPGDRSWRTSVESFGRNCYALERFDLPDVPIVIDAGANIGAFTLRLLAERPRAQVICIEPSPQAFTVLRNNLSINYATAQVELIGCALVGKASTPSIALYENIGDSCTSSLLPQFSSNRSTRVVEVPVRTLRSILASCSSYVDLLKLDVEGAEYEIVLDTPLAEFDVIKNIVIEYHKVPNNTMLDLCRKFASSGFTWIHDERSSISGQGMCWWSRSSNVT